MYRLALFAAVVGAFAAVYQLGSMVELTDAEAAAFMSEFEKIVDGIDAWGIFVHNATLALPMFIPGLGAAWGFFSAWSTGAAFAAITTATPGLEGIAPLSVLFLTPFGLMEVAAYSIAASRSIMLARAVARRAGLRAQAYPVLAEAGAVLALLLAGGYVEYHIIATMPAPTATGS